MTHRDEINNGLETFNNVWNARLDAERKAWDSLSRYKFEMFGYWASAWVKYNQLMPKEQKLPNPFKSAVHLAREVCGGGMLATGAQPEQDREALARLVESGVLVPAGR